LSALLFSDLQFVDRTVLEGAAKRTLDPIERLWPDSYFARLNLRDRTRMQSTTCRQFILANPKKCSFSSDVTAERFSQRLSRRTMRPRQRGISQVDHHFVCDVTNNGTCSFCGAVESSV
jgi:hypothetical protein